MGEREERIPVPFVPHGQPQRAVSVLDAELGQRVGDDPSARERTVAEDDRLRREAGEDYETVAALRQTAAEARRVGQDARAGALE